MGSASFLVMLIVVSGPLNILAAEIPGSAGHHGSTQAGSVRNPLTRQTADQDGVIHEQRTNNEHSVINSDGQYSFAYTAGDSARTERRNSDGSVQGSYSYTDPEGKLVEIEYTADARNGFQALGENVPPKQIALAPYPVQDTPAVAQARAKFLEYYQQEWNARKALEAIENATATAPSNLADQDATTISNPTTIITDSASQEQPQQQQQQQVPASDSGATILDDDEDDDSVILSVQQPSTNLNVPFTGQTPKINPGVQASVATAYTAQEQEPNKNVNYASPSYSLQYEVGNSNSGVQKPISIGAWDDNVAKLRTPITNNNIDAPAYFYYIGAGGLPLYVTSYPARSDVAVSLRATQLGAIPAAAVHDAQTPHRGGSVLRTKQSPPIYVEPKQDYKVNVGSSPFGTGTFSAQNAGQGNYNKFANNANNGVLYYPIGFPYHGLQVRPY